MKLRTIQFITGLLVVSSHVFGQNARFAKSGIIEFEKSVNMFALIPKIFTKDNEDFYGPAFEEYKKNQPQFKKLKSTLTFSNNQTLFVPEAVSLTAQVGFFGNMPMTSQNSTIYTDLTNSKKVSRKQFFDEAFLISDTTRKIKWKITSETREIAGYPCRRANAIVLDSVYVVAFYTDRIPVSGGPESFTGLPGMILGIALPHENITWFATKVTDTPVAPNIIKPPVKGKVATNQEFLKSLSSVMNDSRGTYLQLYLKSFSL
ncbi:MAG: GLPGLI family protein [Sphingobacteriaceae bacterium]|nr:MAG: GLPGLI family protein [Sphingobacteriaceae bacterium]